MCYRRKGGGWLGELTFLCQAIISSRSTARRSAWTLKLGCATQRAIAIMEAVMGPVTPMLVMNSEMLGVNRNGTGRFASRSPVAAKRILGLERLLKASSAKQLASRSEIQNKKRSFLPQDVPFTVQPLLHSLEKRSTDRCILSTYVSLRTWAMPIIYCKENFLSAQEQKEILSALFV